ncbi:MAG: AzlC family ABC transporter permease [Thermomicrobiales bacterium]
MTPPATADVERAAPATDRSEVRRGFLAMIPLWMGVVPFGAAFAILAREEGFSALETQAMSMLIFAGSIQLVVVTLAASGTSAVVIALTAALLNVRYVLYGFSLNVHLPRVVRPPRWLQACLLTDESYGITLREFREGRGSAGFLFGAGLSLYLSYSLATAAGIWLGGAIGNLNGVGLDFVFPLSFLALLLPLLRTRVDLAVAVAGGGTALLLGQWLDSGTRIVVAAVVAAALGSALDRRRR